MTILDSNTKKCRIGVLASGGGTNLQAIIDACESELIHGQVVYVAVDRQDAFALTRANNHGIPHGYFGRKSYADPEVRHREILNALKRESVDLVVLAGYLGILTKTFIEGFEGCILNIHPSLLPKYGGEGFYGERVHQAVLENGEKESGATVHFVNEGVDTGQVLLQRSVIIEENETLETLKAKVLEIEHVLLVDGINRWIEMRG